LAKIYSKPKKRAYQKIEGLSRRVDRVRIKGIILLLNPLPPPLSLVYPSPPMPPLPAHRIGTPLLLCPLSHHRIGTPHLLCPLSLLKTDGRGGGVL